MKLEIRESHGREHRSPISDRSEERVGYRRPPRQHQFKPGQSGNPSGGRKKRKSEADVLDELLRRKVPVREGGKMRKISLLEAIYLRIANDAARGNLKAITFLLSRAASQKGEKESAPELSSEEAEVMKAYADRLIKQAKERGSGT